MRLLRLDLGTDHAIDLHPFVTLVTELSAEQREELVDAIRRVAAGSTTAVRGLIQHQGLLVELDGAGQVRLGPATEAEVVVDTDIEGDTNLRWLRDRIDDQLRRAEIAAARVEELRADVDPTARARRDHLATALAPIESGLVPAHADHRRAVARAAAALSAVPRTHVQAPEGVDDLRRQVADHNRRAREAADHLTRLTDMVDSGRRRHQDARQRLAEAEVAATPVLLSPAEEQRLELLSFPELDQTRKGRWRKVLRSDELAEKQALLDKVGVDSWTAYSVYRMAPKAPRDAVDALAQANQEVAEVEAYVAEVEARLEGDPRRQELANEGEELSARLRALLGPLLPADVDLALAGLRVEVVNDQWATAHRELALLLATVGVVGSGAVDDHDTDLVTLATEWLERVDPDGDDRTPEAAAVDADAPTTADHDAAVEAVIRHDQALATLDQAEAAATEAALGLARLEERLSAAGVDEAGGVDAILARVEPAAVQSSLEGNGSVPVVLVGDLPVSSDAEVERLMSRLSGMTEDLQVIVITSRAAVEDWVVGIGLDRAMVARPHGRPARAA